MHECSALQLPLGVKSVRALDRYIRARAAHSQAIERLLWLGTKGRLTDSGIRQLLERRARGLDLALSACQSLAP